MKQLIAGCVAICLLGTATNTQASDAHTRSAAREMSANAISYLRSQQDPSTGGWSHRDGGPNFPAISGLVLTGMLMDPRIDQRDPQVARGIEYLLSFRKPDGTIHDGMLPSYNTAVCLSALARVHTCDAAEAIAAGQNALRAMQWQSAVPPGAQAYNEPVDPDHPYYGGIGYGTHGRPDLSNLGFMLQALHDTGVSADDPAFQRALTFLARTQMLDSVNDMDYADGSSQGGFIYATVPNAQSVEGRAGQSMAGMIEESLSDGTTVSRLRAYGSMTYFGFKSLIYADLGPDDERVRAALGWITRHYTLEENPGLGTDGVYYYILSFARGLEAFGHDTLEVHSAQGSAETRHWKRDLVSRLAELQQDDGSFRTLDDRWMENNPVLITAYALIALQIAGQ